MGRPLNEHSCNQETFDDPTSALRRNGLLDPGKPFRSSLVTRQRSLEPSFKHDFAVWN